MAMTASHVLSAGTIAAAGAVRASGRPASAAAEMCSLPVGQAASFVPRRDVVLRVSKGQAWVTLGVGMTNEGGLKSGDQIVQAGQTMVLKAGQSVVIEGKSQEPLVYHFPKDPNAQPNLLEQKRSWFSRFQWGKTDGSMLYNI
ncbi:MAG: DUF2917 domain-containing protein [Comamonas sp.]